MKMSRHDKHGAVIFLVLIIWTLAGETNARPQQTAEALVSLTTKTSEVPKIISVKKAKVESLTSSQNSKRPFKISTYSVEEVPEGAQSTSSPKPETTTTTTPPTPTTPPLSQVQPQVDFPFSKLLAKSQFQSSKTPSSPVKVSVSLFAEQPRTSTPKAVEVPPPPRPTDAVVLSPVVSPFFYDFGNYQFLNFKNNVAHAKHKHPKKLLKLVASDQREPLAPPAIAQKQPPEIAEVLSSEVKEVPTLPLKVLSVPQVEPISITPAVQQKDPQEHAESLSRPQPLPQLQVPLNPYYNFAYRVHDSDSGTSLGHSEVRNGNVVHGSYSVMDPDGYMRTVSYTSDPVYGFNALVDRQPFAHILYSRAQQQSGQATLSPASSPSVAGTHLQPYQQYHPYGYYTYLA
jgi:hypothetical protein